MNTKEEKIKNFDPNGISTRESLFGLPFTLEEAEVVVIPVPWEVTVSYAAGTANGPEAILKASAQVDLFDPVVKDAWKAGIVMIDISEDIKAKSEALRDKAAIYISSLSEGTINEEDEEAKKITAEIDAEAEKLNEWVKDQYLSYHKKGKLPVLLGGDHSTPLGFMKGAAEAHGDFGILQIDAHADLRIAYEGFKYSHASIIYNALEIPEVEKIVQVGIRDYSEGEFEIIKNSEGRIKTFFDRDIKNFQYKGESWLSICDDIINELPDNVYLTFDIDGLDPKLCPNTGTPVAGGFEFEQVLFLLEQLVNAGKTIIGFDLNEVAPGQDEWDANVGARLLYRISNLMLKSNDRV
jgi:agmatinase